MSEENSQENEIIENKEDKEESIQLSKVIKKEESDNSPNEKLMEKENVFATKYFMKSY